jgi:hypothetical protein
MNALPAVYVTGSGKLECTLIMCDQNSTVDITTMQLLEANKISNIPFAGVAIFGC